jgi:hypothetical protein
MQKLDMATRRFRSGISGLAANHHPCGKVAGGHGDGLRRVAEAQVRAAPSRSGAVRAICSRKG